MWLCSWWHLQNCSIFAAKLRKYDFSRKIRQHKLKPTTTGGFLELCFAVLKSVELVEQDTVG